MIKKLVYIFIPVFAVLFMSHNVYAAQTTIDIGNYKYIAGASAPNINCVFSDTSYNVTNGAVCGANSSDANMSLNQLFTYNTYTLNTGDIIEFDLIMYSPTHGLSELSGVVNRLATIPSTPVFRTLSVVQTANDVFHENRIGSCAGSTGSSCTLFNGSVYYSIYHYSLLYVGNNGGVYNIGRTSGSAPMFSWWHGDLEFRLANLVQYRENEKSQINEEQKEATQNAADNSATSGNSSSSNSQTATSSLLSVITSGIGAITSASPTNCKINGNMGNLNVGNIDLCSNPVPTFMALIGSIIAVLVVLPLVIVLFNRFISIIRSFQR